MYIYSHNDNKSKNGVKLFFTVLLTIFFTVIIIENVIILVGNERQNYIGERLASNNEYRSNSSYNTTSRNVLSQVIDSVKDSTVGISLLKPDGESILDLNVAEKWGMGTGIIVTRNGYVLTNQHLAQNVGAKLVVTLNDGKETQGKVVWNEPNIDLAIIKIDEKNLKSATLGNSANS